MEETPGNFREAEIGIAELLVLADQAVGMGTADAGIVLAKFFPGEREIVEHFGIADLLEALSARRGTTAGNGGEGFLETSPGAEVEMFFRVHKLISEWIQFQTKPEIALDQIRRARERGIPQGVVLADAGYGNDTGFRAEVTKLQMAYVVGIQSTMTVWKPGASAGIP